MLGSFVAGAYTATLQFSGSSALAMGLLEEGWWLTWDPKWDPINKSDAYGSSTLDLFWQGLDMHVAGVALEWKTNVIRAMQPMNGWAGTGASAFNLGTIGAAASDNSGILVLSSTANTPAAASPTSVTFSQTINIDSTKILFGPVHRTMPLNLQVLPYSSTGIKLFSST